jgi:hypothetical protein
MARILAQIADGVASMGQHGCGDLNFFNARLQPMASCSV